MGLKRGKLLEMQMRIPLRKMTAYGRGCQDLAVLCSCLVICIQRQQSIWGSRIGSGLAILVAPVAKYAATSAGTHASAWGGAWVDQYGELEGLARGERCAGGERCR